jgi:threonine/homoserine/homoserine lactone efflux protein
LNIFCLGIFLSFFGHLIQTEISMAAWMQAVVVITGTLMMFGLAALQSWYKTLSRSPPATTRGARAAHATD